ncbi:MAG: flagellar protein [Gammaproteobacteria bacterium]|nr:flagellar basal body-associated FliL family protein [Gammaproteobacteria bacterium]NNM00264.1 flagellar protein [Gammaproteobacteria bacterium]
MAEKGKGKDEAKAADDGAKGGGKKLIIIGALAGVLVAGGGGAAFFLMGGSDEAEVAEAAEPAPPPEAMYVPLDPAFVVNFRDAGGKTRFLKLELNAMTRDQAVIDTVNKHMPVIRNNLVLLFSKQEFEALIPLEGKEKLREQALGEIRTIVGTELADATVEDLLFTSFVMQ